MKFFHTAISIFIVAGISVLLLSGCGRQSSDESDIKHDEHDAETSEHTVVRLDRHKVFHAGIQVETVEKKSVAIPLSLPGKVSYNERKFADITARVGGRVEKVNVFINDRVRGGDVLLELYSQEFVTIQFEFLQAVQRLTRAQRSAADEMGAARAIYESAKQKLIVAGVMEEDLRELETTQSPKTYYAVRAPFNGMILQSNVRQGAFVQTGMELFELSDLSTLWVLADIYEKDLPRIREGMKAIVEVSAYPDSFQGVITSIYGVVDEKSRTIKARIEVQNQNAKLKPEMFCTVKIQTEFGKETIKIPASALLGDTEKHFVFVALSDTTFEKRDVRTGVETREFAEILDGLLVGEKIVVKGGFFLKSELAKETFGEEH
jgi:Cu(I)/Ag(I) efflux system membrane fusion protein